MSRGPLRLYDAGMAEQVAVPLDEIDLESTELWLGAEERRDAVFATLRREAPVRFFQETEYPGFPRGPGYWALTRYDDVVEASRRPDLFRSGAGTN